MIGTPSGDLEAFRREVPTASGPASVLDTGGNGPAAVFVHGLGTGSYLWRHVLAEVGAERRCVAVDLPLHGRTPAAPDQDFSLGALARFVGDVCDALDLTDVDLVANDTGGAVAQIVAARRPERLHTLTLTNCEAHDNVPPKMLKPAVLLARLGLLARNGRRQLRDLPRVRRRVFGSGYEDVSRLPLEQVRAWLEPLIGTPERARLFRRWMASMNPRDLLAAEPALRRLEVPTLIVWGTDDAFFPTRWAYWLRDAIPGAGEVVELAGARLFLPDERAGELVPALRRHWRVPVG
jgi:pimeloyl-ACP methyl ester carboxylesterase